MIFNSLLWLQDSIKQKLDSRVIVDLGLHTIYQNLVEIMGHEDLIINEICLDEKTIHYRQEILQDFMNTPGLLDDLTNGLKGVISLNSRLNLPDASQFHYLVNLVINVETVIECLEAIQHTLYHYEIHSQGLYRLKEVANNLIVASDFKDMKRDLNEIKFILNKVKSAEVSVNISVEMRPMEVRLTEIKDVSYSFPEAFRTISEGFGPQAFLGNHIKNYCPIFELEYINWDILDELAHAFKPFRDKFSKFLKSYQKIEIKPYKDLLEELTFYHASVEFSKQLRNQGLPQCMPALQSPSLRIMKLKGFYNVNTANEKAIHNISTDFENEVVVNDINMDNEARIFILTGANRGGKTTVTQAIGQIQVLAQLGIYVPAEEASLSLVDNIFTHFSVKEQDTVDLGRLGKECEMFSNIFLQATEKSLLLLNESFSGTSHLESLKIAEEAVMATKYKRMRMIFNTHLHELAMNTSKYNALFHNDTNIVSLVIGNTFERQSFKIHIGEPLGKSFARDEAQRYGVTYEQLTGKMEVNNYGKSSLQFVVVK